MLTLSKFEHHTQPLLPRKEYHRRLFAHFLLATSLLGASLLMGVLGYRLTEGLSWIDSLLNASMILGGMGQVNEIKTTGGKLFASFFSLFSGVLFLAVAGLIIAPVAHRIMHRLHISQGR